MRTSILAGALALGLTFASGQVLAGTHVLLDVQIPSSYTVHLSGNGQNSNVLMGPQLLDFDNLDPFLAFCLDPYHRISLGAQNPTHSYADGTFDSPDYGGNAISLASIQNIAGLLRRASSATSVQQRYIQGAIWREMGFAVTSSNATVQSGIDYWAALDYKITAPIHTLESIPDKYGLTRQSYGMTSVPEAATWAMMILGFGAAGTLIRRRKHLLAFS